MINKIFLAFAFFGCSVSAQVIDYSGSVEAQGILSSDSETPFWFHSNKRGRIDEKTKIASWANASGKYYLNSEAFFELGAGILFHDGYSEKVEVDEAFLGFQNSWLIANIGKKQRKELFNGLSATNENILWSLNAAPMPGISLSTNGPIIIWREGGIGFDATLEEFLMDDNRYIQNARVHHKSFHLIFSKIRNLEISIGFQHFVQWAGTSAEYGELPDGLDNYLRVVTGRGIGNNASQDITKEEINGLGNHLGSYDASITTSMNQYQVQVFWNHIFEDGSGSHFKNFPDGRYGIFIEDSNKGKVFQSFIYELYFTKDQSKGSLTPDGTDNYFNNNLYRSGWTYGKQVLGVPFFTLDENRFRISNNRFIVHHLGLSGEAFNQLPFKFLTSYRKNYGGKGSGGNIENILSSYLDVTVWQSLFDLSIQAGSDFSSENSPQFGIGIHLKKDFF